MDAEQAPVPLGFIKGVGFIKSGGEEVQAFQRLCKAGLVQLTCAP